ncbi:9994_t:CDS:2 [Rhizophagus irregularis]|nr:9994_t:CDS:2 [Rhizophagus irregularis]
MWYLDIAYLKALDSEFSKESMLVSGLEELVEIFDEMLEGDDIWIHPSLLSRIRYSILPDEMAIYERFSDIIKNFSEDKELAYALLDLNLAPTTESQLDRLKNELAITLCDECLMPTRSHECDCWILQIEGF